jgi:peroxiredoxin
MKGANAPDFTIKTLEGKILSLSKLKGNVIVINFWNTQCRPCIAEIPALNEIVAMYQGQNVTFISATYESEQKARDFIGKHPFQFQNAGDAEEIIVNEFLTNDIYPYSMIIDKQGKVSKVMVGGSLEREDTFQQFLPSINECLAKTD